MYFLAISALGAGYYIQDPALCSNICTSRVEFRRFIGKNVAILVPCAVVSIYLILCHFLTVEFKSAM